jgi:hypothetical protein
MNWLGQPRTILRRPQESHPALPSSTRSRGSDRQSMVSRSLERFWKVVLRCREILAAPPLLGPLGGKAELVLAHPDRAVEIVPNRGTADLILLVLILDGSEENVSAERPFKR